MLFRFLSIFAIITAANSMYASDQSNPQQTTKYVTVEFVYNKHNSPQKTDFMQISVQENDTNQTLLASLKEVCHADSVMLYVNGKNCDIEASVPNTKLVDVKGVTFNNATEKTPFSASIDLKYPKIHKQLLSRELTGKKVNGLRGFPHDYGKYLKYMQEKNKQ